MRIHFRFLSEEEACVSKQKQIFLNYFQHKKIWLLLLCTFLCIAGAHAQNILNKKISINVSQEKIPEALQVISKEGNFYFSYDSRIELQRLKFLKFQETGSQCCIQFSQQTVFDILVLCYECPQPC